MRISKSILNIVGKLLLALLKTAPMEQAFVAFLLYLDEKAKKTDTKIDDWLVEVGWLIRDKIWGLTEADVRAVMIKRIQNGTLKM
jgi:hypothetical protein